MKPLNPNEIKVGQIITGLDSKPYSSGFQDRSYFGELMKVVAVDLPFIVLKYCKNDSLSNYKSIADTRIFVFAEPSSEYRAALHFANTKEGMN